MEAMLHTPHGPCCTLRLLQERKVGGGRGAASKPWPEMATLSTLGVLAWRQWWTVGTRPWVPWGPSLLVLAQVTGLGVPVVAGHGVPLVELGPGPRPWRP